MSISALIPPIREHIVPKTPIPIKQSESFLWCFIKPHRYEFSTSGKIIHDKLDAVNMNLRGFDVETFLGSVNSNKGHRLIVALLADRASETARHVWVIEDSHLASININVGNVNNIVCEMLCQNFDQQVIDFFQVRRVDKR
jgi:hypothetical protein